MKKIAWIGFVAVLVGCSSSDYDSGGRDRGGYGGDYGRPAMTQRSGGGEGLAALMPPDDWWHDTRIAGAVNVSADQVTALDNAAREHSADDIGKLERDQAVAIRDLRNLLDSDSPASGDIVNAAQRVRMLRDDMFDRQVGLLAAQRTILTKQQWTALESALREERQERRGDRRGGYPGGTRGRGPMGGRRPGYPF